MGGGTGLGAKYLFDEVPAGVNWNARKPFDHGLGPLGGTSINGSGTVSVVTKGALTNGAAACQANGFFGAFLRFNGIDCLILQVRRKDALSVYPGR